MKILKKSFTIRLPENVIKTLVKYGFDFEKNFEEMCEDTAYYIWCEESNDDHDVGTETALEVKRQNDEE